MNIENRRKNTLRNILNEDEAFIGRWIKKLDDINTWTINYRLTLNELNDFKTVCENVDNILTMWKEYEPIEAHDEIVQLNDLFNEKVSLLKRHGIHPQLLSDRPDFQGELLNFLKQYEVIKNA